LKWSLICVNCTHCCTDVLCVSLRHLGSQLCELEKLIDKMMVEDFTMYARSDLNRSLKEEPQVLEKVCFQSLYSSRSSACSLCLKERLESLVFGLLRQRKLDFLDIYTDEMVTAAKAIVSQVLSLNQKNRLLAETSSRPLDQDACQGSSALQGEAELAYLTHEGLFISDALNEAQQLQESGAVGQDQRFAVGSRFQQNRTETAAESDSSFGIPEMSAGREHSFMYAVEGFVRGTEQLCSRRSMSLRGALQSQANRFVNRFHEERKTKLGTVLLLIRIFLEYCQCVNDIPSITTDMLTRLSDLLKLVVYYIPIIRAHFETKLQPKQFNVLRHFDHITKDYNDHITEISAKLVAIMDSLFEKFLSKLSELHAKMFLVFPQYEVKAPMPSACFRNICKQMAKMHEAIFDLLPEEQTQMLFLRINASFKMHLKRQLARLGVSNDGGPQHG
ncbi:hypothetical protein GOODEAATRI_008670, partial [Goodea atripinnis]